MSSNQQHQYYDDPQHNHGHQHNDSVDEMDAMLNQLVGVTTQPQSNNYDQYNDYNNHQQQNVSCTPLLLS
jgi:hypothetical protein